MLVKKTKDETFWSKDSELENDNEHENENNIWERQKEQSPTKFRKTKNEEYASKVS